MRVEVLLVLAGAAGCGRVSFGGQSFDAGGDDDGDAAAPVGRCGDPADIPPTLQVSGTTFTYGESAGVLVVQQGVSVLVRDRISNALLASTTSNMDTEATYSVDVPTSGQALDAILVYMRDPDLFKTTVFLDRPVATDLVGRRALWNPGDGALWGSGQMAVIYSGAADGSYSRDPTKGTITFQVRDCTGAAIPDVTIAMTPPPEVLLYLTADNGFDGTGVATESTFGSAIAFNAETGAVHVEASSATYSFDPMDITVSENQAMDLVVLRGY